MFDITRKQELQAKSDGILTGINVTMATIKFSPEGVVKSANDNFINPIGYSLADIQEKHHKIFVLRDIIISEYYKTFWTQLSSGVPISGTFKNLNSEGQPFWQNAIYNPIRNAKGKEVKILKLASDITPQQGLLVEKKSA